MKKVIPNPCFSFYISLFFLALIAAGAMAAGILLKINIMAVMSGVFAGALLISGFLVWIVGRYLIKKVKEIITDKNLLAHWTYDDAVWMKYARAEYRKRLAEAITTAVILIILGVAIVLVKEGLKEIVTGILVGSILAVIGFSIYYGEALDILRRSRKKPHEVFIAKTAVYLNWSYISWNGWGARLNKATIEKDEKLGSYEIKINYSVRGRYGREEKDLDIPIPQNKMGQAHELIEKLI